MGFSRQEYWSGLPFPSPGDLPDSGIKPRSPALQADALISEPPGKLPTVGHAYYMHDLIPLHAVQKSVAFLYTKDEISESECGREKNLLKSHQKKRKKTNLGINLTKEMKCQEL